MVKTICIIIHKNLESFRIIDIYDIVGNPFKTSLISYNGFLYQVNKTKPSIRLNFKSFYIFYEDLSKQIYFKNKNNIKFVKKWLEGV